MIMHMLRRKLRVVTRRFARHEAGIAAVEFSLILPILVVLWLGGVEVTQALSVDRRLNNLASAIGDLVARTKSITPGEIDDILDIAPGALYPFRTGDLSMRITAVDIDDDGDASVGWCEISGTPPTQLSLNTIIPATLRAEPGQLIMSEVYRSYTPAVGYVISGSVDLQDRMFFVPRLVAEVQCEDCGC